MKIFFLVLLISINFLFSLSGSELNEWKLALKVSPGEYDLYIDNQLSHPYSTSNSIKEYSIPPGTEFIFLRSSGYRDKYLFIPSMNTLMSADNLISGSKVLELKMERMKTFLEYYDLVNTGSQPKSVEFSPDGDYMAVALLNGSGVEIYSLGDMQLYKRLKPPDEWSEKKGFVETVFFKTRNELWVSQMTTGQIHVFNTSNWKYERSFDCGGSWPKVITLNRNEDKAYISNWVSKDISIIDTVNYVIKETISVNGIPRGSALSPDQKFLYVSNFTSGDINKIDVGKKIVVKNIDLGDGALRHIIVSEENKKLYVSDMYHGTVSVLNLKTDAVERSFYVGSNINTIKLSIDGKKLFISSRGHNSTNGYLEKGPELGKIFVYNILSKRVTDWTWGGNQPTGLAVSPDGNMLAFTDFLDHQIEIYRIQP